jgi:hypothetical protein
MSRDRCYDFKIIFAKNRREKWRFCLKTKQNYENKLIITLVFEKHANFFAENWRKSPKIVIITSTPDFESKLFLRLGQPIWRRLKVEKKGNLYCFSAVALFYPFLLNVKCVSTIEIIHLEVE